MGDLDCEDGREQKFATISGSVCLQYIRECSFPFELRFELSLERNDHTYQKVIMPLQPCQSVENRFVRMSRFNLIVKDKRPYSCQ